MRYYEYIKTMNIDDMAKLLVDIQLNVFNQIKQGLVYCLPLPTDKQITKMLEETKQSLISEVDDADIQP